MLPASFVRCEKNRSTSHQQSRNLEHQLGGSGYSLLSDAGLVKYSQVFLQLHLGICALPLSFPHTCTCLLLPPSLPLSLTSGV
jgi:hypothetical protein